MSPNIQTQVLDALRGQYVQADGGELFTAAVLWQILIELRINNYISMEQARGALPADSLDSLRADALNEFWFTKQA